MSSSFHVDPAASKLLVVDDDALVRRAAVMILRRAGFQVYQAEDGLTALSLTLQHSFALAVSDIQMPVIDGFSLVRSLRKSGNYFPIILMSGNVNVDYGAVQLAGAAGFLPKPFSSEELVGIVRSTLARPVTIVPGANPDARKKGWV